MEFGQSTATLEMNIPKDTQRSFKIEQNRKSFEILSRELYKDEIGSIIREICCNAYDSHIAAGKENTPIVVTLPSVISDVFSVEDFGIGLAEEDVLDLYTTYFKSTKDTSNEFTGAFGLGSKTPFCYTDSFSIESSFNGVTKKYIVYVEPTDGIPAINKVLEEATPAKSNGFKVSFSTKETDIAEFHKKAKDILCHFKVLPDVAGIDLKSRAKNFILDFKNLKIFNEGSWAAPYALMGNVAYPIDKNLISDKGDLGLVNNGCYLFNIGELTVTTSRDSLRYDNKTIRSLKDKIAVSKQEIKDSLKKGIDDAPNMFEARKLYSTYVRRVHFNSCTNNYGEYSKNGIVVHENLLTNIKDVGTIFVRAKSSKGYFNKKNDNVFSLGSEANKEHFIIIDDVKNYMKKTAYWMIEKKANKIYHLILKEDNPVILKKMLDYIGIDSCLRMSEIVIPKEKEKTLAAIFPPSISGEKSKRPKNTFTGLVIDHKQYTHEKANADLKDYSFYVTRSAAGCHITERLIVKPEDISKALKALNLEEEVVVIQKNHDRTRREAEKLGLKSVESLFKYHLYHDFECLVGSLIRYQDLSKEVVEIIDNIIKLDGSEFRDNIDPKILKFCDILDKIDTGPSHYYSTWTWNSGAKHIFMELIKNDSKFLKRFTMIKKAVNSLQDDISRRYNELRFFKIDTYSLKQTTYLLDVVKLINYIGSRQL